MSKTNWTHNIIENLSDTGHATDLMTRRRFLNFSLKAITGMSSLVVLNPFVRVLKRVLVNQPTGLTTNSEGLNFNSDYAGIRVLYSMGTLVTIQAIGSSKKVVEEAMEAAVYEIQQVEALMSVQNPESQLSAVNKASLHELIPVDVKLLEVAEASVKFGHLTDGALDVTVLPLMQLWGFYDTKNQLPDSKKLNSALKQVNYHAIKIDRKKSGLTLTSRVQLDFGGIAKGYAVDRAVQILREYGIRSALIDAGGDIYALGTPPDKEAWIIGIRNPNKPQNIFATVGVKDAAIATSGNYERYRMIDGKRYGHLINPRTGLPVANMLSTTVVAPTTMQADALSTASFVLGSKEGLELLQDMQKIEGVLVEEKQILVTHGLKKRIKVVNTNELKVVESGIKNWFFKASW